MTIRLMTMDDYEQVFALWRRCDGLGLNDLDDSPAGIGRFLRRNPKTCFLAEENGRVLGVILTGDDGRRGYVHHMAVDPLRRKQGIGRAILSAALEALKAEGVSKVCLVAYEWNEDGNAFWEKEGFAERSDHVYRTRALQPSNKL